MEEEEVLRWLVGFSFLGLFFRVGVFLFLGFSNMFHSGMYVGCFEGHKWKRSFGLSIFVEQNL